MVDDVSAPQAEGRVMDPREAQDRLVELFDPDAVESEEVTAQDDHEDGDDRVVALNDETEPAPQAENPFAKEAALAVTSRRVEALLFASPTPLSLSAMADRLPGADVEAALEQLETVYRHRGVVLRQVDKKWQFVTAADVADVLVEHRTQSKKLSRAALETLAIIAYHQPCSRADIEEVRGVAVAKGSLDQLLELGWIRLRGRRDAPGRPVLYGTTSQFLEHFGLGEVTDLPGMADLKAAGLLDARLPPDFSVPMPKAGDDEETEGEELVDDADFATDYHGADPEGASVEDSSEVELD